MSEIPNELIQTIDFNSIIFEHQKLNDMKDADIVRALSLVSWELENFNRIENLLPEIAGIKFFEKKNYLIHDKSPEAWIFIFTEVMKRRLNDKIEKEKEQIRQERTRLGDPELVKLKLNELKNRELELNTNNKAIE